MASYAEVAASGPKQSPEEAAAPPVPEIEPIENSTASLVDVDMPSVHTVSSEFPDQEIKTVTQAERIERENEAAARARAEDELAKKKAANESFFSRFFSQHAHHSKQAQAIAASNIVAVVGVSAYLGYKAWALYDRGRLSWKSVGLGVSVLAAVGVGEVVLGKYIYQSKCQKKD